MEGWQVFFEIPGKPPVEIGDGESIIGRSRNSAVHIPETTVSRQHARVRVSGPGQVDVEDLGSSNGTFVNGEKAEGARKLHDGDRVTVGDAELVIRILAPIEPGDATVRVVIPPMAEAAPVAAAAPIALELPVAAPAAPPATPPSAAATVVGPGFDRPVDPPLRPAPAVPPRPTPPPPPAPRPASAAGPATTRPAGAPPPVAVAPPPPPSSPPPVAKAEVLGSIAEVEKMPLPPAKKGAGATAPVAVAAPGAIRYGGFWIRVAASMIDGVLFGVVLVVLFALGFAAAFVLPQQLAALVSGALVGFGGLAVGFLVGLYYPATKGATPGKRMLGLAIVSAETKPGQGLGWGKAFVRLLGHLVCSFTLSLGYLAVAFTSKKQGLHDMIAGTFVVRTK